MSKIKINITCDCFHLQKLPLSAVIKKCIQATLLKENIHVDCEVNVLITNNKGIRAINQAYRGIDQPTDVLSFPMFSFEPGVPVNNWSQYIDPETGLCPLGDMAISLERAVAQAKEYGHSIRREVGYLTIHSILHLLGYDHIDEGPMKAQMRTREKEIICTLSGYQR